MGAATKAASQRSRGGLRRDKKGLGLLVDSRTSERLGRVRQHGTAAELLVRRAAYAVGLRYRVSNADLPGRPDLANRGRRWAIFVHGCFWHRHRSCARATTPKRNRAFWMAKFRRNRDRDLRRARELRAAGYLVLTVWECEAEDARRLAAIIRRFAHALPNRLSRTSALGQLETVRSAECAPLVARTTRR